MLEMGANKLSKWLKTDRAIIIEARRIVRGQISKKNDSNNNKYLSLPKVLIFDLETSPMRAYTWSRWKQNIHLTQTISEWFMLTWSAKWLGSTEVFSDRLIGSEVINEDDSKISKSLWKLIDEADFVVAHNAVSFDVRKMNARFIVNGLEKPSPYKIIDTKLISKRLFGFSSHKLDALAGYFGIETKMDTDFELWANCMKGDNEALTYMERYNRKDVEILEEVYLKLRPWADKQANLGVYISSEKSVCSSCGSEDIKFINKYHYTAAGKYRVYRCKCGALSRDRNSVLTKEDKKILVRPV